MRRWHDVVFRRAEKHQGKGKAKQLHLSNVASHLTQVDEYVLARGKDKRAVSRLVAAAIKLYKQSTTLRAQSTGLAPDEVKTKVNAQLTKQAGYWRATLEETQTMMDYVHEALPLVGGVVRSVDTFEGSPPDDVSPPVVDLVGGERGAEGSDEPDGSSDGEDPQPADRDAPPL